MRLIKQRKRRERARWFPPMIRIVGGELPAGLVLGATGIYGVPTTAGETTFTVRAVKGPTDFRQVSPTVSIVGVEPGSMLLAGRPGQALVEIARWPAAPKE